VICNLFGHKLTEILCWLGHLSLVIGGVVPVVNVEGIQPGRAPTGTKTSKTPDGAPRSISITFPQSRGEN
jgi:hypothetical protein